jgi:hypothetical protein
VVEEGGREDFANNTELVGGNKRTTSRNIDLAATQV